MFFAVLSVSLLLTISCLKVTLMLMEIKFCHRLVLLYAFGFDMQNGPIKCLCVIFSFC